MVNLLYEELTDKIRQAAYEVHNYFGSGYLEKVYENALKYQLSKYGLFCEQQKPLKVYFEHNILVGEYFADLIIEHKIIIELKAIESLAKIHFYQLLNYLKTTKLRLGLLINFGRSNIEFKRVIL